MLTLLFSLAFVTEGTFAAVNLHTPHVCTTFQNDSIQGTETYAAFRTITEGYFCLEKLICGSERQVSYLATRSVLRIVQRPLYNCCQGYQEVDSVCVPVCSQGCSHGTCSSPGQCDCDAGWEGLSCDTACESDTWGRGCLGRCHCDNGGSCDAVTGRCSCSAGFTGDRCELLCGSGKYGPNCLGVCQCEPGQTCDRFDGQCSCPAGFTGQGCSTLCPHGMYGKACANACTCKGQSLCSPTDGLCMCSPGYQGSDCTEKCSLGLYGLGCSRQCECEPSSCDHIRGCMDVKGKTLAVVSANVDSPKQSGVTLGQGPTAGIVVTLLILVAVLLIALVFLYRRRKTLKSAQAAYAVAYTDEPNNTAELNQNVLNVQRQASGVDGKISNVLWSQNTSGYGAVASAKNKNMQFLEENIEDGCKDSAQACECTEDGLLNVSPQLPVSIKNYEKPLPFATCSKNLDNPKPHTDKGCHGPVVLCDSSASISNEYSEIRPHLDHGDGFDVLDFEQDV